MATGGIGDYFVLLPRVLSAFDEERPHTRERNRLRASVRDHDHVGRYYFLPSILTYSCAFFSLRAPPFSFVDGGGINDKLD